MCELHSILLVNQLNLLNLFQQGMHTLRSQRRPNTLILSMLEYLRKHFLDLAYPLFAFFLP